VVSRVIVVSHDVLGKNFMFNSLSQVINIKVESKKKSFPENFIVNYGEVNRPVITQQQ